MPAVTRRPKRWDHPLDDAMSEAMVSELMTLEPWKGLAAWARDELKPGPAEARVKDLRRHLLNDARLLTCQAGEIVIRVGDYGNSAFVVLEGAVRVVLEANVGLGADAEKRFNQPKRGFFRSLAQIWTNRRGIEERPPPRGDASAAASDGSGNASVEHVPIVLSDVPAVLDHKRTARIEAGGIVGEIAALGRSPRTASIFAEGDGTRLLEIRWQGLRDIRKKFPPYKTYIDDIFRERILLQHLRATPFFEHVGDTPQLRRMLAEDRIADVFIDGMGLRPSERDLVTIELDGQAVELLPLAQGRGWSGSEGIVVWRCRAEIASAAARAALIRALCGVTRRKAVVVHRVGAGRRWQWCLAEAGTVKDADIHECEEGGAHGPEELMRRLLREIALHEIGRQTDFHSYGEVDKTQLGDGDAPEPVIVEAGHYPDGLLLVRAGAVRVSRQINGLERTVSYLGPGQSYGLRELAHNWRHPDRHVVMDHTLRARGYVDTLLIPTSVVTRFVLPSIPDSSLPPSYPEETQSPLDPVEVLEQTEGVGRSMVEFLVDHAFSNGTAAMVIDLERCTRCDDCVRACAQGHNNNPRFIRHGPVHAGFMIANACMHCNDPVCMIGCPTGAISREPTTGQVAINDPTCIGCAMCANNCPYDNIRMVQPRSKAGVFYIDAQNMPHMKATKCDLCVTQAGGPACQSACPHDALRRVDLSEAGTLADWMQR
jgi:Fe-S-cluster-containing dehydrogenase component/CRP-like cAMP-binding protein